jgi:hypothetical protein
MSALGRTEMLHTQPCCCPGHERQDGMAVLCTAYSWLNMTMPIAALPIADQQRTNHLWQSPLQGHVIPHKKTVLADVTC